MTFEELYEYYGNLNAAAKAIGVTRQTAYSWRSIVGYIPYDKQKRFEAHSKNKLIAKNHHKIEQIKDFYHPTYRFYSETHGMCKVKSIIFEPYAKPRIIYYTDDFHTTYTSFNADCLMQGVNVKDKKGIFLFEKDIILHDEGYKHTFESMADIYAIANLHKMNNKFLIVGNTFTGDSSENS